MIVPAGASGLSNLRAEIPAIATYQAGVRQLIKYLGELTLGTLAKCLTRFKKLG